MRNNAPTTILSFATKISLITSRHTVDVERTSNYPGRMKRLISLLFTAAACLTIVTSALFAQQTDKSTFLHPPTQTAATSGAVEMLSCKLHGTNVNAQIECTATGCVKGLVVCSACGGRGKVPCMRCKKTGKVVCALCKGSGCLPDVKCTGCNGSGKAPCEGCSQTGKTRCLGCAGKGQKQLLVHVFCNGCGA